MLVILNIKKDPGLGPRFKTQDSKIKHFLGEKLQKLNGIKKRSH